MTFSKNFPRNIPGSNFPVWEEVVLSDEEERRIEQECDRYNQMLLNKCLKQAKSLAIENGINTEENVASLSIALFEKLSSHVIFWKESYAKEKFDNKNK